MILTLENVATYNKNMGFGVWFCWCSTKHIMIQFLAWELRLEWGDTD